MGAWDEKLRQERSKLAAETREIEARLASTPSCWERVKDWTIYGTTVIALAGGGIGLYFSIDTHFRQRAQEMKQAAEAYEFNVTKEVITLSTQLASGSEVESINAALLLAEFERNAVPILTANLRISDKGDLPDHIISAIEHIISKPKFKEEVEKILAQVGHGAEVFTDAEAKSPQPHNISAIINYIVALGRLGNRSPTTVNSALDRLQKIIQSADSKIDPVDRDTLVESIIEARSLIAKGKNTTG